MRDRRAAELRELELALHWADLHADDPRDDGQPPRPGGPRLVRLGGAGTPRVQDLSICELAIARGQHTLTVRSLLADGLDLRHRLPELYAALREGRCDLWVARRVASMTRNLDPEAVAAVDRAVAEAVDQGAGRLLAITEAKVMEADTDTARAEREAGRARRYVAVTPTDEFGLRTVIAPVVPADGVWIDAILDRVADALDARRDLVPDLPADCTRDELRSVALGWLAHPEDVVALLAGEAEPRGHGAKTRHAIVHVHLHQTALEDALEDPGAGRRERCRAGRGDRPDAPRRARPAARPRPDHPGPGHRPGHQRLGQRLRTPRVGQGPHPPTHRGRRLPPRQHDQPQDRHGPPRPLPRPRPTRTDRRPQRGPTGPSTSPRQDPPGLPQHTARSGALPVAQPPRPPTPRGRHRHPRTRHRPSPRARTPRSTRRRPEADPGRSSQPSDGVSTAGPRRSRGPAVVP